MKKQIIFIIVFGITLLFSSQTLGWVVINEFLADPPDGLSGDANQDGTRSASEDEFVEFLNVGEGSVDLSLWSLWDGISLAHTFEEGTALAPWEYFVIFGGGDPIGFPGSVVTATSGSLRLNNRGDEIILRNALGEKVDHVVYANEANHDQSLTRFPEGTGPFELHLTVSAQGFLFSPGTDPEREIASTPEPASLLLVGVGFMAMSLLRNRWGRKVRHHAG